MLLERGISIKTGSVPCKQKLERQFTEQDLVKYAFITENNAFLIGPLRKKQPLKEYILLLIHKL